jgi:hypothetical protein
MGLDDSVQNAMNRWRIIEEARGRRPRFNMVEHYTHARDLMPVTPVLDDGFTNRG